MKEIIKNLFIGDDTDCQSLTFEMATIHACKTCHQKGVGYSGNLASSHPNYLIYENGKQLYLNMVDMTREFLPKYTHPIMKTAMTFIDKHIEKEKVLVHCNHRFSRSPSIGLLYLARAGKISKNSYKEAKADFTDIYQEYTPGNGIALYMNNHWDTLLLI